MSNYKTLHGVQLQPCCIKTIYSINQRIKNANALQIGAPACIFTQMFFGPPRSGLATLHSVSTTDWGLLAEMVKGIRAAANVRNAEEALLETIDHPSGQLGDFWAAIYEVFSVR